MAATRDSYFPDRTEDSVHTPDIGFEPQSNVPTSHEPTESSGQIRMTPRPGTKRKTSKSSKSGRMQRTGSRSSGDRIRNHHHNGSSQTTNRSATNREIEARRRKEKIRRRKRKHNR